MSPQGRHRCACTPPLLPWEGAGLGYGVKDSVQADLPTVWFPWSLALEAHVDDHWIHPLDTREETDPCRPSYIRVKANQAHSFIPSLIHSFTHSFTHSFFHSFIPSLTHAFLHSLLHSFIHSLTHSFLHSLTHSFTHLLIHSFTHSFTHSFACSLTHSHCHLYPLNMLLSLPITVALKVRLWPLSTSITWNSLKM